MSYVCDCECHDTCHLCGRPFVKVDGRVVPHVNCMDTAAGTADVSSVHYDRNRGSTD